MEIKHPKVLKEWTKFSVKGGIAVSCSFRTVVVQTEKNFMVYGLLNDKYGDNCKCIDFPFFPEAFLVTDDSVVISKNSTLSRTEFDGHWSTIAFTCQNVDEMEVWKKNKILKMSHVYHQNQILLLLQDGSVWKLCENILSTVFKPKLDKAVDISSGLEHALILTESGCVLSFGIGSRGQLGHGDLAPSQEPLQILALGGLKVIKIASGGWHSCAITDSNDLYMWGWNNYGQLSEMKDEESLTETDGYGVTPIPTVVDINPEMEMPVADVQCGTRHTVTKTVTGELFSVGWNEYGQLGIHDTDHKRVNRFARTSLVPSGGDRKIVCGPWSTVVYEYIPHGSE